MMATGLGWSPVLIALVVLLVLTVLQRSSRQVLAEAFAHARDTFQAARDWVDAARQRSVAEIRTSVSRLGIGGENWRHAFIAGAIVITAFFFVFLFCEWHVVAETLGGLGLHAHLPVFSVQLGVLLGLSLVLPLVFGAWMMEEHWGTSRLVATAPMTRAERNTGGASGLVVVLLSFATIIALGLFRAESLTQAPVVTTTGGLYAAGPEAPSTWLAMLEPTVAGNQPALEELGLWERRAMYFSMVALPISLALSAALAWKTGATLLVGLLPAACLAILALLAWFIGLLLGLVLAALNWTYAVLVTLVQWAQRLGVIVFRALIEAFRWLGEWGSDRDTAGGVLARVAAAWVADTEVPPEGIGDRPTLENNDDTKQARDRDDPADDGPDGRAVPPPPGPEHEPERFFQNGEAEGPTSAETIELAWAPETTPSRGWNPFPPRPHQGG
jgi:hypothetical protein